MGVASSQISAEMSLILLFLTQDKNALGVLCCIMRDCANYMKKLRTKASCAPDKKPQVTIMLEINTTKTNRINISILFFDIISFSSCFVSNRHHMSDIVRFLLHRQKHICLRMYQVLDLNVFVYCKFANHKPKSRRQL